jgi:hypothetical protein
MSSGIYRKQYEALASAATAAGISFSTPEGSFNEKFVRICKIIIDDQGGTFSSKDGSYRRRKAVALWQVVEALGGTIQAEDDLPLSLFSAAKALHDLGNDAEPIPAGGSADWRAALYLFHSVFLLGSTEWVASTTKEDTLIWDDTEHFNVSDPFTGAAVDSGGNMCVDVNGTIKFPTS